MYRIIVVGLVWCIALIGCCIMNKLQPNNWWYPAWAVVVCGLFTVYAAVVSA